MNKGWRLMLLALIVLGLAGAAGCAQTRYYEQTQVTLQVSDNMAIQETFGVVSRDKSEAWGEVDPDLLRVLTKATKNRGDR